MIHKQTTTKGSCRKHMAKNKRGNASLVFGSRLWAAIAFKGFTNNVGFIYGYVHIRPIEQGKV